MYMSDGGIWLGIRLLSELTQATGPTGTIFLLGVTHKPIKRILRLGEPENLPTILDLNEQRVTRLNPQQLAQLNWNR